MNSNRPGAIETSAASIGKTKRMQGGGLATPVGSKSYHIKPPISPKSGFELKSEKQESEQSSNEDNGSNECSNYSEDGADEEMSFDGNEEEKQEELRNKFQGSETKTNGSAAVSGTVETISKERQKAFEERKEVTYSAYGINLENTCKLLSCSK